MRRPVHPFTLHPDLVAAVRAATAFSGALVICAWLNLPLAGQFAATTAVGVSLPQLRGAYHIRVMVLLVMVLVISGSAWLGGLAAGTTWGAVLGIGFLAVLSGIWRHLSADYGMPLAVDSALLYLLALEAPSRGATPQQIAIWTLCGGAGAGVLHLAIWLVRPQHALRHAVAECWVATSDLFLAMRQCDGQPAQELGDRKQLSLREVLDRTSKSLATASKRSPDLILHLDHMRHEAAHFAMLVTAFHTAGDSLSAETKRSLQATALDALLLELANMARSVAITLMTHRPENLGITEARLQTCSRMIHVLQEQLVNFVFPAGIHTQMHRLLAPMQAEIPAIAAGLANTVDAATGQKRVLLQLPELSHRPIQALAAWLNPAPSVDPSLVRYAIRMAVLCMIAVGLYKVFHIPRGYWMAFAIIVVLQPDYGSTRKKAAHRVGGTFIGALLGSLILLCPLPAWLLGVFTCLSAFGFGYYVKRRYWLAVFFVTLMLVCVTELHVQVHLDFTVGRLLSNLAGSAMALIAALFLWPNWEREKFPVLLGKAIRANDDYLRVVADHLDSGAGFGPAIVPVKQKAERAGHIASASLERLLTEPRRRHHPEPYRRWAVGALTSNERITRAISVLCSHLAAGEHAAPEETLVAANAVRAALEDVANFVESSVPLTRRARRGLAALCSKNLANDGALAFSLKKLGVETQALVLVLGD